MTDARMLLWVRWRQARGTVFYWLRLTGFNPDVKSAGERVYLLYLLGAMLVWAGLMWAYATYQANALGRALPAEAVDVILSLLPWLILAVAIWLLLTALRGSPIKLTPEDMTYFAASPLPRGLPVLLGVGASLALVVAAAVPVAVLTAVAVSGALGRSAEPAMLQSAAVGLLLAALLRALAWLMGLLGLAAQRTARRLILWLVPVALVGLAWLAPGVVLWPALVLAAALRGAAQEQAMGGLLALAVAVLAGVGVASARVNMVAVAEASAPFGRARSYGLRLPALPWPGRRRRLRGGPAAPFPGLPGGQGLAAVVSRSALTALRRPGRTLVAALQAAGIAVAGAWVVSQRPPLEVWSVWLLLAVLRPPRGLLDALWTDWDEPFLRQFLPYGNLSLFLADVAVPGALATVVAVLAWGATATATGLDLLSPAVALAVLALLLLCQAAGRLRVPEVSFRVRYPLLSGASLGLLVVLGVYLGSPLSALAGGVACCALLTRWLAGGEVAEG